MKKIMISIFLIVSVITSAKFARETGYGYDEKEAKKEALSFLTQSIAVDVKSSFQKKITQSEKETDIEKENIINVKSNLPMLGVIFTSFKIDNEFMIDAELNEGSIPLYEAEMNRISKEIEGLEKVAFSDAEKHERIRSLELLLTRAEEYNKYYLVLSFLKDDKTIEYIFYNSSKYELDLRKLKKIYDSIDLAVADNFTDLEEEDIYVYPVTEENSSEITEFAGVLKGKVEAEIYSSSSPEYANYIMRGQYTVLDQGIAVNYKIYNLSGKTIKSFFIMLEPEAYSGLKYKSTTADFDKLLKSGVVVSSDFKVDINSSRGKIDLLFEEGELFNIVVKVNKPSYFYIIGHTLKDDEKYSYLIDFNEAYGDRKFVTFIGADDTNKWIDLGEFEAIAPFGVETLQVFASTKDLVDSVPRNYYDNYTGLYKLGNAPKENLKMARAIIRKRKKTKEITESFLIFTTMEKIDSEN
jgi:hypothetical protein